MDPLPATPPDRSRRSLWWTRAALIAVVAVAVIAVVVARHTDPNTLTAATAASAGTGTAPSTTLPVGPVAPTVVSDTWLNTAPLTPADLAGKVVLYDFWTFGCINCQHTLPHVKAWYARYAADGLVVLSIHSPEFPYEADAANVADYVRTQAIAYPVALDPKWTNWRAFQNQYWPAFYLHDRDGHQRMFHAGEGAYDEMENAIRSLLGVAPNSPRAVLASMMVSA